MSRRQRNQPYALLFAALLSTAVSAQSFVGGDTSGQAPFSLPPSIFSDLTTNPNSDVEFPVTGYNVSASASSSDATGNTVNGWSLDVHLTADVPLSRSDDNSINKDQFFQATKMSLIPPNGDMADFDQKNWMVCGIVFTGGLKQGSGSVGDQGSCGGLLPDDCIQQIQVNGVSARNKTAGDTISADGAGRCEDLELPSVCGDYFQGAGGGSAFEIKSTNSSAANTGRMSFFAAGSAPVKQKNDQNSIQAAEKFVWPVLLTWTHFGQGSDGQQSSAHDSAGWLSCVQAPNSTTDAVVNGGDDGGKDSGAGDRLAVGGFSIWAGIVGVWVVGLAAVL